MGEPAGVEPEAGEDGGVVAAGGVRGDRGIAAVGVEAAVGEFVVALAGVDDEVLGDAGGFVLAVLADAIGRDAVGRHELDDQISRSLDAEMLHAIQVRREEHEDVGFPAGAIGSGAHEVWTGETSPRLKRATNEERRLTRSRESRACRVLVVEMNTSPSTHSACLPSGTQARNSS